MAAMATSPHTQRPPTTVALTFFFLLHASITAAARRVGGAGGGGISLELIHRDSPRSPFHMPNATTSDLWLASWSRSLSRHRYITESIRASVKSTGGGDVHSTITPESTVKPPVVHGPGEYLAEMSIGTPPQKLMLVIDTGSMLVWVRCGTPGPSPSFTPRLSSSFDGTLTCYSQQCLDLKGECHAGDDKCKYTEPYFDGTLTGGYLALDTFTFPIADGGRTLTETVTFGCSDYVKGVHPSEGGILGLNAGGLSLVTQLGIGISRAETFRMSYCLVPDSANGKLLIGEGARLEGKSTPMATGDPHLGVFYFLDLDDISVGSERIGVPPGTFKRSPDDNESGLIIDSGTTLTFLKPAAFDLLAAKLKEKVKLPPVSPPSEDMPAPCFKGIHSDLGDGSGDVPNVTFHFAGGLDVELKPANTFGQAEDDVVCLAMVSSSDMSMIGIFIQQDMNVGYDLDNQRLYIAPADCASP